MAKNFAFASRACNIAFFDDDPITVALPICGSTDEKIRSALKAILDSDKQDTEADKVRIGMQALGDMIGASQAKQILDRSDEVDSYAIQQVAIYVRNCYVAEKAKNLSGSLVR